MQTILDIKYVDGGKNAQSLDLYLPDKKGFPVFVYFHGGGLVAGDKAFENRHFMVEDFIRRGVAVVSANYRMYPEASYPDFIEDAADAVAWVRGHIRDFGGNGDVYVGGSSAGGYISMMLCFDPKYLGAHGILPTDIAGYVHDAGQPTTHFNVLKERGVDPRRAIVDEASPLWHVGLAESYSPMIFIVAQQDMFARYEQTMLIHKTLEHFKYDISKILLEVVPGATHTSYVPMQNPDGTNTLTELAMKIIKT